MSSDSSSSTSGDNPEPKPKEDHLTSVSLTELDGHVQVVIRERQNGVEYVSARESDGGEAIENRSNEGVVHAAEEEIRSNSGAIGGLAEAQEVSEGLGRGGVVWHRTISELEVDGPASPSSSGYAGERGTTSSSSSGSVIDEIVDDEIREVTNNASDDGVLDSEAAWVPGKRHADEVFHDWNSL